MSTGARLGILAGIIVVAIVALVIAGGGSDDKTKTTPTYRVTVKNAKPVGGIKRINVNKGDQVKLVVNSDTADEIHFHGYDFKKDVKAGGSVTFNFKATIDGSFEAELEDHKQQIAELTVEP
jgi:hypothetical protein